MQRKAALDNIPEAPAKANPTPKTTHSEAQTLPDFFTPGKTPYEFWLTCAILIAGLLFAYLAIRFLRQIHREELENATRAMTILFVIMATMVLITAGYNNEQIAPAFGLFGTIVGYILGRSEKGPLSRDADSVGATSNFVGTPETSEEPAANPKKSPATKA